MRFFLPIGYDRQLSCSLKKLFLKPALHMKYLKKRAECQKKEQKKMAAMLSALEIGDCVLTNSGFYGIVIDITEDTVIVEFGNNKNCRIPMQKTAIAQVEKADNE